MNNPLIATVANLQAPMERDVMLLMFESMPLLPEVFEPETNASYNN